MTVLWILFQLTKFNSSYWLCLTCLVKIIALQQAKSNYAYLALNSGSDSHKMWYHRRFVIHT
jgi:integral membrane sensor domain MASE1